MNAPAKSPIDSIAALLRRKEMPPVGLTPHAVAWTENKWRLLEFGAPTKYATPILLVHRSNGWRSFTFRCEAA